MSKYTNLFLQILFVGFLCFSLSSVNAINKAIESGFAVHREAKKCERFFKRVSGTLERAKAANNAEDVKALNDWLTENKSSCDTKAYPSHNEFEAAKNEVYFMFGIIMSFFFAIALLPLAWSFLLRRIAEIGNAFRGDKK
jgi:hypothetical protein